MHSHRAIWKANAENLLVECKDKDIIINTFFGVFDFAEEVEWFGACHAISSVLHILFKKQGIQSELYLGEVAEKQICFNHSWIEIKNEVYDVAIVHPLDVSFSWPPTFSGCNLETKQSASLVYGSNSGIEDDPVASMLREMSFIEFMNGFPNHKEGLWGFAEIIGRKIDVPAKAGKLKKMFSDITWKQK
jgi:hypothetical protein